MTLFATLLFSFFLHAEPLSHHKAKLESIDKRLRDQEIDLKELEAKKSSAREGLELDDILNDIAKIHMELLKIRKERTELKTHLRLEHPNDDLMYDARLHKDKERVKKHESNDPVDKRLDELIALMRKQYARYAPSKSSAESNHKTKLEPVSEVVETSKERYIKKAIPTQMKVRSLAPPKEEQGVPAVEKKEEHSESKAIAPHSESKEKSHH